MHPPGKLPVRSDDPVDVLIHLATDPLLPVLRACGHTPNVLTTYSFLCGLAACWALYHRCLRLYAVLFGLAYVFDCMDGRLARAYGLSSRYGDLYDHITDVLVLLLLVAVVLRRKRRPIGPSLCLGVAGFLAMLWPAPRALGAGHRPMLAHTGCQQRCHFGEETLNVLRSLCPAPRPMLPMTRAFGPGCATVLLGLGLVPHLFRP